MILKHGNIYRYVNVIKNKHKKFYIIRLLNQKNEYVKRNEEDKKIIIRRINVNFVEICQEPSRIFPDKTKLWEIVRSVF